MSARKPRYLTMSARNEKTAEAQIGTNSKAVFVKVFAEYGAMPSTAAEAKEALYDMFCPDTGMPDPTKRAQIDALYPIAEGKPFVWP